MGSYVSCRNSTPDNDLLNGSSNTMTTTDTIRKMNSDATEHFKSSVCDVTDIPENGVKSFDVEGSKILVANTNGNISAVGGKCTHYGAPLEKGSFCNGVIRCPWHGACFNVQTGDIEDFPGVDSIPKFEVEIDNGRVHVKGRRSQLQSHKWVKPMCKKDTEDERTFIVLGAGGTGAKCVETLRQEGFTGRLILISDENALPYDRTKLSKMMHMVAADISIRSREYYEEANIELELGSGVRKFDSENKIITLENSKEFSFDKILLATGGRARKLSCPGGDLDGVFVLRNPTEANRIVEFAKGKNVVVVGSSFIGMEAAAYLISNDRAASVTVVGNSSVPFERSLGSVVGSRIQKMFEEKNIKFMNSNGVSQLLGEGSVEKVVLKDGEELPAEVVIAGIGVEPSTEYLENSGVALNDRKCVVVNQELETNVSGVYCGGDIASFPLFLANDDQVNIGHWQMAHQHGHLAALNMLGRNSSIKSVPFFWTMLFGKGIRYAGYGAFDYVVIQGDIEELSFVAFYCQGEKVIAVATMGRDPVAAKYANYLSQGSFLTKEQVLHDSDICNKF